MAAANRIAFTMQTCIWSRSSSCHGLIAFFTNRHKHSAKLRIRSCLAWLVANGRELGLKALLNDCFLPILLDEKNGKDGR